MTSKERLEELRNELVTIADLVQNHKEVAKRLECTPSFLFQVRKGENNKKPTTKNIEFIKQAISCYKELGADKLKELNKAFN